MRQSTAPASPPQSGDSAIAAVWTAAKVPTASPSRRAGVISARPASSSGVTNAFALPCAARSARNTPIVGERAAATEAIA